MDLFSDCHSWWKLDDDAPDYVVLNEIDTNYNGTLNASYTNIVSSPYGKLGKAFYLDADMDHYVRANDVNCCQVGSGDFTGAIWLRSSNPRTSQRAFSNSDADSYGFELCGSGNNGYLIFRVKDDGDNFGAVYGDPVVSGIYVFDGDWHFLIVQRIGNVLKMWADNVVYGADSSITGSLVSAAEFCIGARSTPESYYWNEYLDQMMFWLRALSATERKWLWNNGNGQLLLNSLPRPLIGGSLAHGRGACGLVR